MEYKELAGHHTTGGYYLSALLIVKRTNNCNTIAFTVEYKGLLDRHAMGDGYLFAPLRPNLLSRINFNLSIDK